MLVSHCLAACFLEWLREQTFQKNHVKSTQWRWTAYAMKRISWRLGCHHTQRLAPMPFISACVSLQQLCRCTIDLESLGIKQRQERLFNVDASDNLYETSIFFRFHRLHWLWNLVQVGPDLSKETCEEHKVEMDSICNEEDFMEARLSPHTATGPNAIYLSLCQPAATVPLHHWFGELGNQTEAGKAV